MRALKTLWRVHRPHLLEKDKGPNGELLEELPDYPEDELSDEMDVGAAVEAELEETISVASESDKEHHDLFAELPGYPEFPESDSEFEMDIELQELPEGPTSVPGEPSVELQELPEGPPSVPLKVSPEERVKPKGSAQPESEVIILDDDEIPMSEIMRDVTPKVPDVPVLPSPELPEFLTRTLAVAAGCETAPSSKQHKRVRGKTPSAVSAQSLVLSCQQFRPAKDAAPATGTAPKKPKASEAPNGAPTSIDSAEAARPSVGEPFKLSRCIEVGKPVYRIRSRASKSYVMCMVANPAKMSEHSVSMFFEFCLARLKQRAPVEGLAIAKQMFLSTGKCKLGGATFSVTNSQ